VRKTVLILVLVGLAATIMVGTFRRHETPPTPLQQLKAQRAVRRTPSVDHAKLAVLNKTFSSAQEVTTTCLSCHTEAGTEVMASSHWNWSRREYVRGRGIREIGKKNILNNFCIGVTSNLEGCDSCHAGYGYVDGTYDFGKQENIDCLACHDNSGTYAKGRGGLPVPDVNLTEVARHVGRPQRANCGACHFFGGGGNNVKHGDLEVAQLDTTRDVDVHMASDGANLACVDCHTATNHRMVGKSYALSSMNRNRVECEQCHGSAPHATSVLNEHTLKVGCQTCHIPEYAKVNATKMVWDWSTAGHLKNGVAYEDHNQAGNITYASIKGTFTWATHVKPDYIWFNGTASHYLLGDQILPGKTVQINTLYGGYADRTAKIVPVKIHKAVQIFDPVNRTLVQPKLWAAEKGQGGFWKDFDFGRSAEEGMKTIGLPYSGQYAFTRTESTLPLNHMVAPKAQALACTQCHQREQSRLAGLTDFYLPGRDRHPLVDGLGSSLILLVLGGVFVHGAARIAMARKRGRR
jgi:octaheme c-type cytochrome (tetrathionate reductase family)